MAASPAIRKGLVSDDPSAEGPEGRFLCHRHTQRPPRYYPERYSLQTFGTLSTTFGFRALPYF